MAVSIINPSAKPSYNFVAFFNFYALNTLNGKKLQKELVYLDRMHFGKECIQDMVAEEMHEFIEYNINHIKIICKHYNIDPSSVESKNIDFSQIEKKSFEWDWFQIKSDNILNILLGKCNEISKEECADRLADILLNHFLAMRCLNTYSSLSSAIQSIPDSSDNVIHFSNSELDGYDMLVNSIFRIRIGWDKLIKLLVSFHGVKPRTGFGSLLKSSEKSIKAKVLPTYHPILNLLANNAHEAVINVEIIRNAEEHNHGIIAKNMGDRTYIDGLYRRVLCEFNRFQSAIILSVILMHRKPLR